MTRTLVVYHSQTGYTKRIAQALARRLDADLEAITPLQPRAGVLGYAQNALEAMAAMTPAIAPPQRDPAAYDLVVIGTPVWFWSLASPVRTWAVLSRLGAARVAFFCTMGGSGAGRVFDALEELAGRKPVATLALTDGQIDARRLEAIDGFVKALAGRRPRRAAPRRTRAAAAAA